MKTGVVIPWAVVRHPLHWRPIDSKSHWYFKGYMKMIKGYFANNSTYSYLIFKSVIKLECFKEDYFL